MNKGCASRSAAVCRPRLICFPYAGAFASVYSGWQCHTSGRFDIVPVGLPGRGARFLQPPIDRMDRLAEWVANEMRDSLAQPFAFFGHSMGAVLAFETARYLRKLGEPLPRRLLVSGTAAPQSWRQDRLSHNLPEPEFIEYVRELNGTPPEVFEHRELLEAVLPSLRADFAVCETYEYRAEPALACPVTAFGGSEDPGTPASALDEWASHTTKSFGRHIVPGGHFFIQNCEAGLVDLIAGMLEYHTDWTPEGVLA